MESKQLKETTKKSLLKRIDKWIDKKATSKVNEMRFDTKLNLNHFDYRMVSAIQRILKTDLASDLKLSDSNLEKFKLYINGV